MPLGPMIDSAGPVSRPDSHATIETMLAAGTGPLFSFELFPPKDDEQRRMLWQTVRRLEALGPDFVSVTYGANGSSRERTIEITEAIAQHTTLRTMAHLTCASQPVEQLRRVIGWYAAAGIRHVMAIRGDMPGGPTVPWVQHPEGLRNATELVELVRSLGDFCVGVGAFPDLHPERHDADLDARVLVEKSRAGASFAISQLFFTPSRYFELVDRVRSLGCDIPIIPGIMPVTRLSQIQRFAELSGADLPRPVVDRLERAGDDPAKVRQVGIDIAFEVCQEVLAGGAPGLHFLTMNRSLATREIFGRLRVDAEAAAAAN
jgi:methylenetetrahydrofolate reductase (NADPH)